MHSNMAFVIYTHVCNKESIIKMETVVGANLDKSSGNDKNIKM